MKFFTIVSILSILIVDIFGQFPIETCSSKYCFSYDNERKDLSTANSSCQSSDKILLEIRNEEMQNQYLKVIKSWKYDLLNSNVWLNAVKCGPNLCWGSDLEKLTNFNLTHEGNVNDIKTVAVLINCTESGCFGSELELTGDSYQYVCYNVTDERITDNNQVGLGVGLFITFVIIAVIAVAALWYLNKKEKLNCQRITKIFRQKFRNAGFTITNNSNNNFDDNNSINNYNKISISNNNYSNDPGNINNDNNVENNVESSYEAMTSSRNLQDDHVYGQLNNTTHIIATKNGNKKKKYCNNNNDDNNNYNNNINVNITNNHSNSSNIYEISSGLKSEEHIYNCINSSININNNVNRNININIKNTNINYCNKNINNNLNNKNVNNNKSSNNVSINKISDIIKNFNKNSINHNKINSNNIKNININNNDININSINNKSNNNSDINEQLKRPKLTKNNNSTIDTSKCRDTIFP